MGLTRATHNLKSQISPALLNIHYQRTVWWTGTVSKKTLSPHHLYSRLNRGFSSLQSEVCRSDKTYYKQYFATSHPGQLSLAISSWVSAMSTSQRTMTLAVKLCDPLVTHGPYLSALEIRSLYNKAQYKFSCLLYFTFTIHRAAQK